MHYGFIGFGHLAKAIYHGLKKDPELAFAYHSKNNQHPEIQSFETLKELVSFSDVIWLCVKPQVAEEVLDQLKEMDLADKLIVSTLAGKSLDFFQTHLGLSVPLLRIMPNLAMAYGQSVTAYCANAQLSAFTQKVKANLETLGEVLELPEAQFDLFTAIFGSGPAFLLEFLQSFKCKALELNLTEIQVNLLLIQLLVGTGTYFKQNIDQKDLKDLIQAVASKGGVTEAGLSCFRQKGIGELMGEVIEVAKERSEKMGMS